MFRIKYLLSCGLWDYVTDTVYPDRGFAEEVAETFALSQGANTRVVPVEVCYHIQAEVGGEWEDYGRLRSLEDARNHARHVARVYATTTRIFAYDAHTREPLGRNAVAVFSPNESGRVRWREEGF